MPSLSNVAPASVLADSVIQALTELTTAAVPTTTPPSVKRTRVWLQ